MKQTTKSERQSNAERRRVSTAAVSDSALKLFVEQGYGATAVDQIGADASLTKGAVYFYFKDKQSLLLELLARSEAELYRPIFSALKESEKTGREKLDEFLQRISRAGAEKNRDLLLLPVLMSLEFSGQGDEVENQILVMYERTRKSLGKVIRAGQKDGSLRKNADHKAYAALIVSLTDGILLDLYRGHAGVSGAATARASRDMIIRSLESSAS